MRLSFLRPLVLLPGLAIVLGAASNSSANAQSDPCLANAAFCDTFDTPAGIPNSNSGQLNGNVWGVSRVNGDQNLPSPADGWGESQQVMCGQNLVTNPTNDVQICNGQLVEGYDDAQVGGTLAMYPKQPFDFAGRTGKVVFDVADDSQGNHGAWPEFWMSDKPVPAPFAHEATFLSLPANGFGLRFAGFANDQGKGAECPEGPGYVGVDSAITVASGVENDTFNGGNLALHGIGCVKQPSQPGQLNHFEIDVSQNQLDVYGTDAGTVAPLKHLATIPNANLSFTRGLIWLEDAHYNANKFNTQGTHQFIWDNVGFDGPVLPQDRTVDILDNTTVYGTNPNNGLSVLNLGWYIQSGQTQSFDFQNTPDTQAAGSLLVFGYYWQGTAPLSFSYNVNGNAHTFDPTLPQQSFSANTIGIPLTLSELRAGDNTIAISPAQNMTIFNIDLIMVGEGGIPGGPTPP